MKGPGRKAQNPQHRGCLEIPWAWKMGPGTKWPRPNGTWAQSAMFKGKQGHMCRQAKATSTISDCAYIYPSPSSSWDLVVVGYLSHVTEFSGRSTFCSVVRGDT